MMQSVSALLLPCLGLYLGLGQLRDLATGITQRWPRAEPIYPAPPAEVTQPPAQILRPGESPFGRSIPVAPNKPETATRPAESPFVTAAPAAPIREAVPATPALAQPAQGLQQSGEAGAEPGTEPSPAAPKSILAPSAGGSAAERPSSKGSRKTRFTRGNSADRK